MKIWEKLLAPERGDPLSMSTKFSKKLTFLTPWYIHVRVRIRGFEMLGFMEILCTYLMDDPKMKTKHQYHIKTISEYSRLIESSEYNVIEKKNFCQPTDWITYLVLPARQIKLEWPYIL